MKTSAIRQAEDLMREATRNRNVAAGKFAEEMAETIRNGLPGQLGLDFMTEPANEKLKSEIFSGVCYSYGEVSVDYGDSVHFAVSFPISTVMEYMLTGKKAKMERWLELARISGYLGGNEEFDEAVRNPECLAFFAGLDNRKTLWRDQQKNNDIFKKQCPDFPEAYSAGRRIPDEKLRRNSGFFVPSSHAGAYMMTALIIDANAINAGAMISWHEDPDSRGYPVEIQVADTARKTGENLLQEITRSAIRLEKNSEETPKM